MRFLGALARACLLLFAFSPMLLRAQFPEPTREELQMTSDPKAPGAPYVYLFREDITDQPGGTHVLYERIKILTEKGKGTATVRVPWMSKYEKFPEVEGRTIHADGTVVPLSVKPTDVMDVKTKAFEVDDAVFTLPDVQVGSILEYRIKEEFSEGIDDPT